MQNLGLLGGQSSQYCANGTPYYYPGTTLPLVCTPGVSRCPGSSTCQPSQGYTSRYPGYCCYTGDLALCHFHILQIFLSVQN